METRAFICIDFPEEIVKETARIQNILNSKTSFSGKITELENLHLTLKFLGHLNQQTLNKVKEKLSKIKFPPLDLKLHSVGTFSYRQKPKIVWLKITGNIFNLQKTIDETLSNTHLFKLEERFMSHLAIARIKHTKNPQAFIEYISQIKPRHIKFQVNEFKLKSSDLKPEDPVYKELKHYNLNKNA